MGDAPDHVSEVNIRVMTDDDIEGVLSIDRKITGSDRAVTYATIPGSYVGGELDISVVAEADGEIVGFLLGRITDSPYGHADAAWLEVIGVDPSFQRRGLGTRLVQGFTERCRQRRVRSVHILVSWHDWRLLSFLRSLRFARGEMAEFIMPIEE